MIEVEVKSRIKNIELLKVSLNKIGAVYINTQKQTDKIFGNPIFLDENTKVIEGGYSARIRQVDNDIELTFKEIIRKGGGLEIESRLNSIESGTKFLSRLNFKEAFTLSKTRENYKHRDFSIAVDRVDLLGDFIEIEKLIVSDSEIRKAREECISLMQKIMPDFEIVDAKYGDLMQDMINKTNA
ncbi:MAG: hypothetical protein A2365_03430 [Candidatus Nealsonbacteria bacterium RIFOXYB1_FULL_40_15]|uniref:CYTH domain-containing protein n=2 Tax=Candidatus Nealsoniibacteriota TaxID=1817911 RepID=A0A1G2ERD7_9BACT|nr:MAG: hypothetical protein A2365_03430 [Candidatus Nealsonbacteria bacterium RIFOXYB1_FULL_40_15]OGZ28356.1 MAG: hypothetical protein A2427_01110 [Candidatus Nealsonbacteria bacterium RIFOXYC1_FULL_40_7]OGZ29481.1 MAG: hypothetical protein A2562_02205 [Candidatus Nealsonbacteria bacterium RIFOXYD1_FULL_39_11]